MRFKSIILLANRNNLLPYSVTQTRIQIRCVMQFSQSPSPFGRCTRIFNFVFEKHLKKVFGLKPTL
jgi:hypothetical protein